MRIVNGSPEAAPPRKKRRLRYVQTLPTLCTVGNLICGFGAIHLCLRATWLAGGHSDPAQQLTLNSLLMERLLPTHVAMAAYLIFLAMVFDALDGRLARWSRHTTDFGAQLDSLADVVSFGVAPPVIVLALLMRQMQGVDPVVLAPMSHNLLGRFAWVMVAVYVACSALRLARFNVENEPVEQAHQTFRGLPSPGAAAALASLVILYEHVFFYDRTGAKAVPGGTFSNILLWFLPIAGLLLGLLMVSRFHYAHLVNKYLRRRRTFADIIKLLFVLVAIAVYPEITFAGLVFGYALSGPVGALVKRATGRSATREEEDEEQVDSEGRQVS